MKMSVGLPVIVTPIPAYEAIVKQGSNGFLATSPQEWMRAFDILRDPALRRRIGRDAHDDVSVRFSKQPQADKWLAVLDEFTEGGQRSTRQTVALR
jgi:glycosyltransferase involved in cell wall biosynthesis